MVDANLFETVRTLRQAHTQLEDVFRLRFGNETPDPPPSEAALWWLFSEVYERIDNMREPLERLHLKQARVPVGLVARVDQLASEVTALCQRIREAQPD
jgi:hypothetical protein